MLLNGQNILNLDFINNLGMVNGEDYCLDPLLTPNRPSAYSGPLTFTRSNPIATVVNASGLIQTVGSNVPRIDYDPVTRVCKGLLIEEARTNLMTYSDAYTFWVTSSVTFSASATTIAPDGTLSAYTSTATATTGYIYRNSASFTGDGDKVWSVFVKAGTSTTTRVFIRDITLGINRSAADITWTAGVPSAVASTGTLLGTDSYGNGWYRIRMLATNVVAANTHQVRMFPNQTTGTGTAIFWGVQVENGSFVTSYIPTMASNVTRSAEVCSITGSNFNNWFNQSEGTVVIGYDLIAVVDNQRMFSINDNSSANDLSAYTRSGGTRMLVTSQGTTQANPTGLAIVLANTIYKAALGFKTDDFAISVNGATVATDTSGSMPLTGIKLNLGSNYIGGGALDGYIRFIQYYPTRLSNATLQSLTS